MEGEAVTDEDLAWLASYHRVNAEKDSDEIDLGSWDISDVYKDFRRHLALVPRLLDLVDSLKAENQALRADLDMFKAVVKARL